MDKDNVVTSPLAHPSDVEALRHPGDSPALRQPGSVVSMTAPTECALTNAIDDRPFLTGKEMADALRPVELNLPPPGVPPLPCNRTPRCAPEFTPGQAAYATHEAGMELVRAAVALPQMPPSYEATRDLARLLRTAQSVVHVWADTGAEVLGEISHASPGVHAAVMNVSGFAAQAHELVMRAVGRPSEWAATFDAIMSEASKHRAFRLIAIASSAMLAGPFTETWDNAVEFCLAYWRAR